MADPDRYDEMAAKLVRGPLAEMLRGEPTSAYDSLVLKHIAAALREAAASAPAEPCQHDWVMFTADMDCCNKCGAQRDGEISHKATPAASAPASLRKLADVLRRAIHGGCTWHLGSFMNEAEHALEEYDAALAAPAVSAWSSTPPDRPGWYWWRAGEQNLYAECVHVLGNLLTLRAGDLNRRKTADMGGQWQGPIEPK